MVIIRGIPMMLTIKIMTIIRIHDGILPRCIWNKKHWAQHIVMWWFLHWNFNPIVLGEECVRGSWERSSFLHIKAKMFNWVIHAGSTIKRATNMYLSMEFEFRFSYAWPHSCTFFVINTLWRWSIAKVWIL